MKIGVIGAGPIGQTVSRLAREAGHEVMIANSRAPETLAAVAQDIDVHPVTAREAATADDFVVVAIPQRAVEHLSPDLFQATPRNSVVVDTGNYFPSVRDGLIAEIEDGLLDSEWVARRIGRQVVKAFNMIEAHSLATRGSSAGSPGRIAIALSGDDASARNRTARLVEQMGFDVVDNGPLSESWRHQPGTLAYCHDYDSLKLRAALGAVKRSRIKQYREESEAYVSEVVRLLGPAAGAA